jgi:hypothetical protein
MPTQGRSDLRYQAGPAAQGGSLGEDGIMATEIRARVPDRLQERDGGGRCAGAAGRRRGRDRTARHRGDQGADGDTPVRAQPPRCLHLEVQGGLKQRLGRDHGPR